MNPAGQKQGALRFGVFELDLAGCELRKNGTLVKLQSQPFQLLALLAGHPGQIVSREEIRRALWSDETFVDFDQSINFCANKLRDALDDDPQRPWCIETVPRKGYRFVAPIVALEPEVEPQPSSGERPRVRRPRWFLAAGAALVLLAIALAARTVMQSRLETNTIKSLAVLPFENLSADPEQQYFADGMTDDLITDLAKIRALRVISRTSVMQYKGTKKPVPEIARELNVDAVLEGTIMRDRDRVRITVQLIRASPEKHLWADRYEEGLGGILTLQDKVAKAVAREIRIKVTPREQAVLDTRRAVDPEAYEAYSKGRYLGQFGGEKNLAKSLEYFQQAVQKDPAYALAWAGVARDYNNLASWGVLPRREAAAHAQAAAEKALQLDSSLVEGAVALAGVKMDYEWDWSGAERLLKNAIELSPNSGRAHAEYAGLLAATDRKPEAVAEMRLARQAEPLDSVIAANLGWKLYLARNYEEAEREGAKWEEWHKPFRGDYIRASIFLQTGRTRQALEELRVGASESHHQALLELMYLGHALGVTGARDEGRKILAEMQVLSRTRYVPPDYIAMVYEGLGDRDQALQWYEKAVDERSINLWVLPDQRLDSIRSDPRFKNLMRRMGLDR
jgi:TolB-like protein/DNA-binding winged helix-turn-helix (wHTH) protein/Tfp pilus assembly protein PilF